VESCNADAELLVARMITIGAKADFSNAIGRCPNCDEPLQADKEILGVMRRVPIICKCRVEAQLRDAERDKTAEQQRRLDRFRVYSLMDKQFSHSTFENWELRADNQKLYDFAKGYCENWDTMFANNRGVLLHGKSGNGKTYAAFSIANELYKMGKAVLAISISRILEIIKDSYNKHGDIGEIEILNILNEASLLILDDLGVEYKTPWVYEKLYSIIDIRYRARKPVIITTNLSPDELMRNLSIIDMRNGIYDNTGRIYNRIIEMCTMLEATGDSWRIQKAEDNQDALYRDLKWND